MKWALKDGPSSGSLVVPQPINKTLKTAEADQGAWQHPSPVQKYTQNFRNTLTYTYAGHFRSRRDTYLGTYFLARTLTFFSKNSNFSLLGIFF